MSSIPPDTFIHAANVLLLVAYSVRDILWLRLFAVAASIICIPYYLLQPTVLWPPLAWSVTFAGINLFQSWRLFLERQPVKMTEDEAEVRRLAFADAPPRKVLQVLGIGAWTTESSGKRLIESGKVPDEVALVVRGKVRVTRAGSDLGLLGPGALVGSALILSGVPADFDAVVEEPVRAVRWRIGALDKYLNAHPDMRIVMQRHLARELSKKLGHLAKGETS
ncbi:MAG TPA: cyclic nucleotide-binding domain-containing protein [Candidatus Eisenbacteria bacterium]|nr:cyclic nucleotide-binding domain-containing protein [Candidatus Eisenbacteria bacterium]